MKDAVPKIFTTGRIAAVLGVPLHRVLYVLKTRQIPPRALAGNVRLYDAEAVARVREALRAIGSGDAAEGRA